MGKEVVKELIQNDCSEGKICAELKRICETEERSTLLDDYQELEEKLGEKNASRTVAKHILEALH